jgi:hypothetical protein
VILDLSPSNAVLYAGLKVQEMAGKVILVSPAEQAMPVIGRNLVALDVDPEEVVLTGGMAIWAYLTVFHLLHGRTRRSHYQDGRGNRVLVAAHG